MSANAVLLVVSREQLAYRRRIWGTGGWLPPQVREGLDWLALCRFAGLGVDVCAQSEIRQRLGRTTQWVILALGSEELARATFDELHDWACHGGVVICPARERTYEAHAEAGKTLEYGSVHRTLRHAVAFAGVRIAPDTEVLARLDGVPLAGSHSIGRGKWLSLGFHPSVAADADGAFTALLRDLLLATSTAPAAWLDNQGVLVLRMDDPGAAQNLHLNSWRHAPLDAHGWREIAAMLAARNARLSIGYCAGWVDDGDSARGDLQYGAGPAPRMPGQVLESRFVRYRERGAGALYDYASGYAGIAALVEAGLGDCEIHGYTHQHPDTRTWAAAADRYESVAWFRELGSSASEYLSSTRMPHPIVSGARAIAEYFAHAATTLICPGDEWTDDALEVALECGLLGVSSYYFAVRDDDRLCWATHVEAPYLDRSDARWLDRGLPVIGYFHEREPACYGGQWLREQLDAWAAAGVSRFVDFRELHAGISRRFRAEQADEGTILVTVYDDNAPPLVRPLHLGIRAAAGKAAAHVHVRSSSGTLYALAAHPSEAGRFLLSTCTK